MKQDERTPFVRALQRARVSAHAPGEFVGQESFMRAGEIRALAGQAGIAPGVSVLDLCCGVAGPGRLITQELGCTYLGVDVSTSAIDIARESAADLPCRFEVSRIPPIPPGPFDVALMFETMLAFPEKEALLTQISAALPTGGRFAFTMEEGLPLTDAERQAMPDADTVWLTPLREMLTYLERAGLVVRWQDDCSRSHRAVADSLIAAFSADAPDIAAQIGGRALEELLTAHRLWSHWLREGRVRKIALVAEKLCTSVRVDAVPVASRGRERSLKQWRAAGQGHVSVRPLALCMASDCLNMDHLQGSELTSPILNGGGRLRADDAQRSGQGVMVVDTDLRVVLAEGPECARRGFSTASARDRRLGDVVPSELLDELTADVRAALAGEARTLQLPGADAAPAQHVTLTPWRSASDSIDGVVLFFYSGAAAASAAQTTESERRYRLLAERATDVVSLRDRDGIYRYISPSVTALSGYSPEELVGRHVLDFVHRDDRDLVAEDHARLLAGEEMVETEYRIVRPGGSTVWVRTGQRAVRDPLSGELTEVRTSTHDITERLNREAELHAITAELKQRLRETGALAYLGELALEEPDLDRFLAATTEKVIEILRVPLCAVLMADADGLLRVRAGTGWQPDTIGRRMMPRAALDSLLRRHGHAPVVLTEPPPDPSWRQLLREHHALSSMWMMMADRDHPLGVLTVHGREPRRFSDDDRTFLVAVANILRDAIARHRGEEAARHDALHDALTGLPNRRMLTDRLDHALARSARSEARHAVLFLDLDQFKLVNDSLGHSAGDRLLRLLGPRLNAAARPGDTVARFGGDEFVVLCEDVGDEDDAAHIARRLADTVNQPFDLDGREHVASASIGVAVSNGTPCTPEELLRDADTAMYRAKEAGRGRFELFDAGMRQRTLARLELEDELRRALAGDALILHYQPIYPIDAELPTTVEALVRWQHPERGLLPPAAFIEIAEETNLIVPLGEQVLRRACSQMAHWRKTLPRAKELAVSVNVSARQLSRATFDAEVARTLAVTGLPAHALCLEITEGVLLQDSSATAYTIAQLRARGVRIVLDDFGTGYSSLSYLQRFSLDILKIDRSFVSGLEQQLENRVIVEAIIMMAHAFGLDVTAEGLETPEQLDVLRDLGCANVQGYLLGRPMPAADIEHLLGDALP